jgi:type VI secretion system protein ImpJ
MVLGGSPDLKNLVRDLANQVDATRKEMLIQLTRGGFSMEGLRGIQFEQLLRLRSVSRMASPLAELVKAPATTPLEAYLALRELLGELAALKPDRPEMYDVAAYDHANPGVCFRELNDRMRALLVGSVRDSFQKVEFKREADILVAALSDDHLNLPNEYFLGIKTGTDPRAVAALVEDADQFKLMAKSMVQRNIFGVKLVEERHPPTVLPAQAGLHYYRLNRHESERMWGRIKEEKEVALRWPGLESSDFQCALYMPIPESK